MSTIISFPGGTNIYIRQNEYNVQWSSNQNDWSNIVFPCFLRNTNTTLGFVKVNFTTNITLTTINDYFNCISDKIQIGSETLNVDGTRPKIIIYNVTNYPGFIQNLNNNYVYVYNLEVLSNNSTLSAFEGWICQQQFSQSASNNYVINCYSNGDITNIQSGGIVGISAAAYGGSLNVIGCSFSGSINSEGGGGIVSSSAGLENGSVYIVSCWTTGIINANSAGGIIGQESYNVTITNCYSQGSIVGIYTGGICGRNPGLNSCSISNCYSLGIISGNSSGGICSSVIPDSGFICNCSITNCYSIGNINGFNNSGGIIGEVSNINGGDYNVTITNCYTSGRANGNIGYIVATYNNVSGSVGGLNYSNCFSEAFTNSPGGNWITTNANTVLNGIPLPYFGSTWANVGINQPYELYNMGYSPYSLTNITSQNLNKTTLLTLMAGNSTRNGLTTESYSLIDITEGDSNSYLTITINSSTGKISTTSETLQGTYTLYIRNGSYNYSTVILTVIPGIFLVTLYKKIIRVPYINNLTIENIKTEIYNQIGMPQNTICLTFKGRILEDNRMLSFYNIQYNDTLHISLRHPKKG